MKDNIQLCATVSKSVANQVAEIAVRDNRTLSQTVSLLLQQAVKERNRKRNAKKLHIQNNPTD